MRQALQALLISPGREMRIAILEGRKTVTIREDHRDYKPGHVVLCCHLEPWAVMADLIEVRHCTLREVTGKEWLDDGFEISPLGLTEHDQEEILRTMRQYYPNLELDSPVTVVRWTNVSGYLAENKDKYKKGKI